MPRRRADAEAVGLRPWQFRIPKAVLPLVLVGACASPTPDPPIERSRVYPQDPAEIAQRVEAALRAQGLELVEGRDGQAIRARQEGIGGSPWAACGTIWTYSKEPRRRRPAAIKQLSVEVVVAVEEAAPGTRVQVDPQFPALATNTFVNRDFETRCASTGTLEQAILDAI